jgi:hypothetical protein
MTGPGDGREARFRGDGTTVPVDVQTLRDALRMLSFVPGSYEPEQAREGTFALDRLVAGQLAAEARLQAAEHALREIRSVLEDDDDWDLARNFARILDIVDAALAAAPSGEVNEQCGHPVTSVVQGGEGTAYCGDCADAAAPTEMLTDGNLHPADQKLFLHALDYSEKHGDAPDRYEQNDFD